MKGEELLEYMSELDPELVEKSKDCGPGLKKEENAVRITDGKGKAGRKIGWRRIALVAAAVAVFTAACTYGAKQLDLDVELANRLGVRTDEAQKLGDGLVEINESCTRTVYNEETGVDEDYFDKHDGNHIGGRQKQRIHQDRDQHFGSEGMYPEF